MARARGRLDPLDVLRSSHPGPTAAVTLVALVMGIGVGLEPVRLIGVVLVILANQLSIGLSNDAIDEAADRQAERDDKPVASGRLGAAAALRLAIALAALSVLGSAALGLGVLVANAVFLGAGWIYNLGVKRTPLSPLPYLVGFAALPGVVVYAVPGDGAWPVWWATAAAALLGGAAHFGNVLPDLIADRRAGSRGLPQLVGRGPTVVACFVLLAASGAVLGVGLGWSALGIVAGASTLALAAAGIVVGLRGAATRWLFRLVMAAAIVDVATLALAGGAVLA